MGRGWEPIKGGRRVEREFEGSGGGDSIWTLSRREGKTQGSYNSCDCCVRGGILLVCLCEKRGPFYSFWLTRCVRALRMFECVAECSSVALPLYLSSG